MPYRLNLLFLVMLLLGACYSPVKRQVSHESITARAIYQSVLCGGQQQPRLNWITAQGPYRDIYAQAATESAGRHLENPPMVDFSEEAVLLISMGQRPTAGYRLRLSTDYLHVRDGELTVPVIWTVPAAGELATQVITHPCLILVLPRTDVRSIMVRDQADTLLLNSHIR